MSCNGRKFFRVDLIGPLLFRAYRVCPWIFFLLKRWYVKFLVISIVFVEYLRFIRFRVGGDEDGTILDTILALKATCCIFIFCWNFCKISSRRVLISCNKDSA